MPAYKDSDGRWRFRFSYNGKRYSGTTPRNHNTKKAAETLERQMLDKLMARQYTGKMPTLAEHSTRFLDYQRSRVKPMTYVQQAAVIKTHILPHVGRKHLDRIATADFDYLATLWAKNSVAKTINVRLGTFRRMLSLAVEWDYIAKVPRFRFLKVPQETPRFLSDEECTELVAAAEPHWRAMVLVALRTGLRIGELRGLQWHDVSPSRRTIQVRRTDPGRRHMDATSPKGNRERTVPLTRDAVEVLEQLKPERAGAKDFVWPALMKRDGETRLRARSEKGCFHALERATKKAGIKDCGWHTLRHTYASHLVMRGVPIRLVQKWLGHASIKETEKYSHLSPDFGADVVDLLDMPLAVPDSAYQHGAKRLPPGKNSPKDSVAIDAEA